MAHAAWHFLTYSQRACTATRGRGEHTAAPSLIDVAPLRCAAAGVRSTPLIHRATRTLRATRPRGRVRRRAPGPLPATWLSTTCFTTSFEALRSYSSVCVVCEKKRENASAGYSTNDQPLSPNTSPFVARLLRRPPRCSFLSSARVGCSVTASAFAPSRDARERSLPVAGSGSSASPDLALGVLATAAYEQTRVHAGRDARRC